MRLNPNFILRRIAGEALLISIEDPSKPRRILFLNELGNEIYLALQEGLSPAAIEARLLESYEVSPQQLHEDVSLFLNQLVLLGVLLTEDDENLSDIHTL